MALVRKLLGGKKQSEDELEDGHHRRNTIQIITYKKNMCTFVVKILVAKILQQLLSFAYLLFIVLFRDHHFSYRHDLILPPIVCWSIIFIGVHFVHAAPSSCITTLLLILTSLSLGYFMGGIHSLINYYFLFIPTTLACLILTNLIFLIFFLVPKLWLNARHMMFYIVPQIINLVINIILIGVWISLVTSEKVTIKNLQARSKLDGILILVIPTLFWSFALNLLMANRLKLTIIGELYFVSHQKSDFLFVPLYFI